MARHYLTVIEALVLILLARILVARVRFGRWRDSLGAVVRPGDPDGTDPSPDAGTLACACAHAVERAAVRLPRTLCLPKAMALQWMLKRRRIAARFNLGSLPGAARNGSLDDLHAWVEIRGQPLMSRGAVHRPVLTLQTTK